MNLIERLPAEEPPDTEAFTYAVVRTAAGILRRVNLTSKGWMELSAEIERRNPRPYVQVNWNTIR